MIPAETILMAEQEAKDRAAARTSGRSDVLSAAIGDAAAYLSTMADQLDGWADESRRGGWSTHQVAPNMAMADSCRRMAARLRRTVQ